MKSSAQNIFGKKGFTLVELLVVIAIIAILASAVLLIINPLEFNRRSRDVLRLQDLANLQQAISVAVQEATASSAAILCHNTSVPCPGHSTTGSRATNGGGWVKVDISTQKTVTLSVLPVDPLNSVANHYTYCSNGNDWEIDAVLESSQHSGKMSADGGNEDDRYEVGSTLGLIALSGGSCTYTY